MTLAIPSIESLPDVAAEFLRLTEGKRVFAFQGSMGAGKTTFVKSLCEKLGVCDTVNSPTFAIVNEYADPCGEIVAFHFDFYRLKSVEEAIDMGAEDYFYSGKYCFLEWPELVEDLLPEDALQVSITEQEDGSRLLVF